MEKLSLFGEYFNLIFCVTGVRGVEDSRIRE